MGIFGHFMNVFFSSFCVACDQKLAKNGACEVCQHLLTPRSGGRCTVCALSLRTPESAYRCHRCLTRPPKFDQVIGLYEYEGPAGEIIRRGKYQRQPETIGWLCQWMRRDLPESIFIDPPEVIIPIPLHWRRRLERRFDPPLWLAKSLGDALQVPVDDRCMIRHRETPVQAGLNDAERRKNVRSAFRMNRSPGTDVLIVDDVFTTGATANAASQVLKEHGCERVRVFCAAYVDPTDDVPVGDAHAARTVVA